MATKRTVALGISGSIAAYKAPEIASQLVKAGHTVHCIMTRDATHFITPLTLETVSRQPVTVDLFAERDWCPTHVAIADSADMLLIAPATANIIAKLALGIADDALSTIALALRPGAKTLIAPAMNGKMWLHPATQANVATLKKRGAEFIGPDKGLLACGYEGIGRLWPVDKIVERALELL
ncbi:MAG: phosphopantothenoylcysteine decarboxylase [Verrucomicrobiae bacterium]|nr:phosphopantothenoylcysteine decarboxylase [Verrucomicrobiae bacterium]